MDNNDVLVGNKINIVLKYDDVNLIDSSKKFLKDLEEQYREFKRNFLEIENDFKNAQQKGIYFIPEALSVMSPLTIIDAPWGSGKTYFVEGFVKNFANKKITSKVFKNIIVMDVYRYATYDNISNEIMLDLFDILIDQMDNDVKAKNTLRIGAINICNTLFNKTIGVIKSKTGLEFKERQKSIMDELSKINKNIDYTIIILDNIERIGPNSWEILKAIIKISQLDKIIFVLPMNSSKMLDNSSISNNEHSIEKFISIKHFNLIQDYTSLLKNLRFNVIEQELVNDLLIQKIKDTQLSLRQLKKMIIYNKIMKLDDSFNRIKRFEEKIWNPLNNFEKDFKNILNTEFIPLVGSLKQSYRQFILNINNIIPSNYKGLKKLRYIKNDNNYFLKEIIDLKESLKDFWSNYELVVQNDQETRNKILNLEQEVSSINKNIIDARNKFIILNNVEISQLQNNIYKLQNEILNMKNSIMMGNIIRQPSANLNLDIIKSIDERIESFNKRSAKNLIIWRSAIRLDKINENNIEYINQIWEEIVVILSQKN